MSNGIERVAKDSLRVFESKPLLFEVTPLELLVMLGASALVGGLLVILYQRLSHRRHAERLRHEEEAAELAERKRCRQGAEISSICRPTPGLSGNSSSAISLDFNR